MVEAARSGRWSISGPSTGEEAFEQRFADAFAAFAETRYAVPASSGSAALLIALEALGVGIGDEVLVPALGWVACASAVLAAGADPVFVDIDPFSLGMSLDAAEAAVSRRTRACVLVHLLGCPADVARVSDFCARFGVELIEDASQAHGGRWCGRRLSSFGRIGIFSLQQSKLLTTGEGGVAVTDDEALADRLHQLRADGRTWRPSVERRVGLPELCERGHVQGHNHAMSAFQAAVGLAGLERIEHENAVRHAAASRLTELLEARNDEVQPARRIHDDEDPVFWRWAFRVPGLRGRHLERLGNGLSVTLDCDVYGIERPLPEHRLYQPAQTRRRRVSSTHSPDLPQAHLAVDSILTLPHRLLLGGPDRMDDVVHQLIEAQGRSVRGA